MHARRSLIALCAALLCSAAAAQVPGLGAKIVGLAGGGVFSAWNPADAASGFTFSNSNLTWTNTSSQQVVRSTTSRTTGKYYFEATVVSAGGTNRVGVATATESLTAAFGADANGAAYYDMGAVSYNNSVYCNGSTYTAGDIIGVAVDLTNDLLYFSKNGAWQCSFNPSAGTGGMPIMNAALFAASATYLGGGSRSMTANFGKTAFSYTIPTGFSAWH